MASEMKRIDISGLPELLTLVEEVRSTRRPRLLGRDGEDLAILMPVKAASKPRPRRGGTKSDYEAFRSAAGGWKDVDTDRLIADIYADRRISNRPAIEL